MEERKKRILHRAFAIGGGILFGVSCFFGGYFTYAGKVDDEIKTLIWAKEVIQEEYNYKITDEEFYEAVFSGVNSLLDPYSAYLSKDEYKKTLEDSTGRFAGIGVQFSTVDTAGNPQIMVSKVLGNSPAEREGLKVGSSLLEYGNSQAEMVGATNYEAFSAFLKEKEEGEAFYTTWKEEQKTEPYTIVLCKEAFIQSYVSYRSNDSAYQFLGAQERGFGEALTSLPEDTAYIRLTEFNGGAGEEFDGAMSVFKRENKKNLILDLRANGGGYLSILSQICKYFCKSAKGANPIIATANYRNGRVISYRATANVYDEYFDEDSEITVLADSGTASASECLIGCMVDYGAVDFEDIYLFERVAKIGEEFTLVARTYGKGIMQEYFSKNPFKVSPTMKLTTAYITWPLSGRCIHGIGVIPENGAKKMPYAYFGDGEIESVLQSKR